MEITLTPELERFIADEIADGAFETPQELVLALLSLYREKKLAVLGREIMVGVEQADRGETLPLTRELIEEIWQEGLKELESEESAHERAAPLPSSASGPAGNCCRVEST
jgi:antitoxin ParD1/3/4